VDDRGDPARVEGPLVITEYRPGRHRLARSVAKTADGAEICLPVNILRGPRDGPRLVAIAGIHGDEHDGPAALLDICDELDPNELTGTLVVVPIANPPAFRTNTRWNVADGQNLNRIFPGEPDGSISHWLARQLVDEVIPGADFVLTIHGWTTGWLTVPYVEYTLGHATTEAARSGAKAFGLSYLEPLGLLPGRLMSTVAGLGIPGCEVEIGGEGITLPARAEIGRRGVMNLLRHLGMKVGKPALPDDQRDVSRYELRAHIGGVFRRAEEIEVGRAIARRDALGTICGLNGEPLADVIAPAGGIVACLRHALSIEPGDLLAVIFADA
jgi:predicted deacylase